MKKSVLYILAAVALTLVSWGKVGHSTVATIAQKHLTPHAQAAVSSILGINSMADISSYADAYRDSHPDTKPWHFLNLELGLSYDQFVLATKNAPTPNIYSELLALKKEIASPTTSKTQKGFDLKFLIHFVGDAHQPMHISRKEDHGGNDIKVKYNQKWTDLHTLWDDLLIDSDQPNYPQMAAKVDQATLQQIQQWQSDDIFVWLYESYKISSKIYAESPNNTVLPLSYYSNHIGIVEERLEKGGIRLAGVLNKLFQ